MRFTAKLAEVSLVLLIMVQSAGFIKIGCVMGYRTVGIAVTSNTG